MSRLKEVTALKCLKCEDIIWSRHVHDFRTCSCGASSIDGGRYYSRVLGDPQDYELCTIDVKKDNSKNEDL